MRKKHLQNKNCLKDKHSNIKCLSIAATSEVGIVHMSMHKIAYFLYFYLVKY